MDKSKVKDEFLALINSIEREGFDKDGLIRYLTKKSDFFDAPATTKYRGAYPGGLAEHSLNTYRALCKIILEFSVTITNKKEFNKNGEVVLDDAGEPVYITEKIKPNYSEDTLKIVGLLFDIAKANFYEEYNRNVKDDSGKWQQVKSYKVREDKDRFIYGSHEQTSEFMVRTFVPLTVEESVAILHHLGGQGFDSTQTNIATIYEKYPLALFLHIADMLDTFASDSTKIIIEDNE